MSGELVLVTGGSGFVAAHCILQLLQAGYTVRTSVRSLKREPDVREMMRIGGVEPGERLSFAVADLLSDAGWAEAVACCAFVLHVASPFPQGVPKHEDDLIIPARDGTLRVLAAARDAGVKRVVLTSSFAAIGYGEDPGRPYTEEDWTDPASTAIGAYVKSKTLAERAAWDFMTRESGAMELSVVNPVGVFGPVLGNDYSSSVQLIKQMIDGKMPAMPRLSFGVVDVRDVADLHLRAMTDPAAKGERFLAVAGDFVSIEWIAKTLKTGIGGGASRVPRRMAPNWLVKIIGLFSSTAAQAVPGLGKLKNATNAKARRVLGWSPRSNEEAVLATAESLLRLI